MPLIQPWYLTGLIELAGSFTYSRTDRNIVPYFALKLGEDDAALLDDVRAYLGGLGRIYAIASRRGAADETESSPRSHYYRVTRIEDLEVIVHHFDEYPLRGRKAEAYAIWREIVDLKRQRYRRPERERLDQLCGALSATASRKRSSRG